MTEHPRDRLSAFLDGELPREQSAEVERHLRGCTECARELSIMRELGGAMRTMPSSNEGHVWEKVHRRITRPAGWLLLLAGLTVWLGLAGVRWLRAELTFEWLAATGIGAGVLLLLVGVGHEQYREWKTTRYKDVRK